MLLKRNFFFSLIILYSTFSFISLSGHSLAAETTSKGVRIINYGIYAHTPDNGKSWINPISDKKITGTSTAPVHIKTTRTIPAQYPLFFGFEYQLNNLDGKTAKIETIVNHPEMILPDGTTSIGYQQRNQFLILEGQITATNGYLLEAQREIVPGKWTFKIKYEGETIIEQQFHVTGSL